MNVCKDVLIRKQTKKLTNFPRYNGVHFVVHKLNHIWEGKTYY